MSSAKRIILVSVAALAVSSWTTWTYADELSTSPPATVDGAATTVRDSSVLVSTAPASQELPSSVHGSSPDRTGTPEAAVVRRNPFGSKPLEAAALSAKRGGDRVFNDSQLKGVVADNQASNLTTGMNVISEGAFAGSSGLSTVIQNTGNNVLIQNATIVNVQLK
jgi:hypothetical protein